MISTLAGKNMVISTGEGRSRSALKSSSLMEEGLEENTVSVSRSSWKEKRYLSQNYVLELSLQDKNPMSY